MKVIKRICDVIDLVNDWIGRIASFAVLGILAVIVTEVVLRRLFHSPQIWTMDVICMTFGCYIIMVCAYGFQKKAFVAVDVLYARLKPLAPEHSAPDYLSGVLCSVRIRARARELRIFPSLVYHR